MILDKLAIKPLLITIAALSVLLLVSGWFNVSQFKAGAIADTEHAAEIAELRAATEIAAAKRGARQSDEIAAQAEEQRILLAAEFDAIAEEQRRINAQYAGALSRIPPLASNCGPGQDRVDAFNGGG
jgi:hypothetical protein